MKKIILAALVILSLSSCKKWLSISPKSEISSDDLFQSEQGFKDALMGAYLLMTDRAIYGFETTIGFVDVLAQQYPTSAAGHPYVNVSGYQYLNGTFVSMKDNVWSKSYSVIANLNNIINNIDSYKDKMDPVNYEMIKSEALGLRAFVHLDLYRLFGYGNLKNDPQGLNVVGLPYVNTYSKKITPPMNGRDYLNNVEKDLLESESLTSNTRGLDVGGNIANRDPFYINRRMRFNYYAIKATQARLYLWKGDYEKARNAAEIVTTIGQGKLVTFQGGNINDPNPVNKDYTFSTEHIFALNIQNMFEYIKPYIDQYGLDGVNANSRRLAHNGSVANTLYEINTKAGMSLSDYRYKELYKKISQTDYLLLKFTFVPNSNFKDRLPLIKLPEMYYILAECYNELGDSPKAVEQLNTVRTNRGIATTYKLSENLTQVQVQAELQLEYRKEFVSEGQLFYFYKRRGNLTIPNTNKEMNNSVYVLPLPEREIEIGN